MVEISLASLKFKDKDGVYQSADAIRGESGSIICYSKDSAYYAPSDSDILTKASDYFTKDDYIKMTHSIDSNVYVVNTFGCFGKVANVLGDSYEDAVVVWHCLAIWRGSGEGGEIVPGTYELTEQDKLDIATIVKEEMLKDYPLLDDVEV